MTHIADLLDNEPVARKRLTVFIIVDVSRSMRGNKLRTVNSVMREVMPELKWTEVLKSTNGISTYANYKNHRYNVV